MSDLDERFELLADVKQVRSDEANLVSVLTDAVLRTLNDESTRNNNVPASATMSATAVV